MTDRLSTFVEVVLVHGMGRQRSSETLLEWAEPLVERMQWLAGTEPEQRVVFGHVKAESSDDDGRVAGRVVYTGLDGQERDLIFGMREARWAEAFLPMKSSQVFSWGADFLWQAALRLGSYFGRVLRLGVWQLEELRRPPTSPTARLLLSVPLAVLFVLAWLAVAAMWAIVFGLAVIVAVLLPALSVLLLFPVFNNLFQAAIDGLVEFVGDVAVWTQRPVRAAAMRDLVRSRITEARANLRQFASATPLAHTTLVVLAHSQGAAITADVLFDLANEEEPVTVDAFVSVGAAITLLGVSRWPNGLRGRVVRAITSAKIDVATEYNLVEAWACAVPPTRWLNFWAIWDPFAAGPISTSEPSRIARWRESYRWKIPSGVRATEDVGLTSSALGPEEHPVHNTALPLTDHQSYSSNITQVIDPVARLILDLDPPTSDLHVAPRGDTTLGPCDSADSATERLRNRLHVRGIKALGLNRLLVVALAASAVILPLPSDAIRSWTARLLAFLFSTDADTGWLHWLGEQSWLATVVVVLGVAIGGLWLNARLWRYYRPKFTWRIDGELADIPWIGGTVLRIVLVSALWWVLVFGTNPPTGPLPWPASVAAIIGLAVVFAPGLGLRPLVVPERRI